MQAREAAIVPLPAQQAGGRGVETIAGDFGASRNLHFFDRPRNVVYIQHCRVRVSRTEQGATIRNNFPHGTIGTRGSGMDGHLDFILR